MLLGVFKKKKKPWLENVAQCTQVPNFDFEKKHLCQKMLLDVFKKNKKTFARKCCSMYSRKRKKPLLENVARCTQGPSFDSEDLSSPEEEKVVDIRSSTSCQIHMYVIY